MNKRDAKIIAEKITNEELKDMFETAKRQIKDWTVVSDVNPGMTKGTAWNILGRHFDVNKKYMIIAKINFVREFGDYLSTDIKTKKIPKLSNKKLVHQEPIFE